MQASKSFHAPPEAPADAPADIAAADAAPAVPAASPATLLPQGCTNFKLRQLMRRVASHYDTEMAQCGLKTTQYSLLSHVLRLGPIRPGDLAEAMKMDASTLTRNLRPLVDAGWVTLEAGADARSRLVHITDAGRSKRAEAQRHWKAAQLALNETLGVERVAALHALVDDSLALLAALPAEVDHGE
ncbi:MarR family winged helix-turn-helix transcriptional regulator [Paracidovorax sp. MALMAid1276]|uniref:MarR family winged helix-turn-helix transcriptional regulator n=1 Tax=Paracidovorax sp. MALMAid1276 TaxID=3411631 RepID=UPI003B9C904C